MTYIPAKQHGPATNLVPTRVVIHCTVSPCVFGGAVKTARYFQVVTRPASAHWVHDPGESVRCLPDEIVAYHAPPNTHSLGHEMCDPQSGSAARWDDALHKSMMSRCAKQVAADCRKYGIPVVKIGPKELLAGKKGICGHIDVSLAWHQTTHTNPGVGFPWTTFINLVKSYYNGSVPTPKPPPTGDDVPTQLYSQTPHSQVLQPGWSVLGTTTFGDPPAMGVSFAAGSGYFSGYVGAYLESQSASDQPVLLDLHTVRLVNGVWVPGSTIDAFEAGYLGVGTVRVERPVQIYLPPNYRLRAGITIPPGAVATVTRGFTRLLNWSA